MIDYAARRRVAATVKSYLNEEIKAFQFSDALYDVAGQTDDSTVQEIVDALWYHYDDLKDHKIVASKEEWDYFHRLLLILESDAELETDSVRKWSFRQPVAVCALAIFAIVALCLGSGLHLLVAYVALGLVSMLLSYSRSRAASESDPTEIALTPFSSISQLLAVRRHVPRFSKKRYPSHLRKRMVRHWISEIRVPLLSHLVVGMIWLAFAPVPLAFQAMPETLTRMRVRAPQQAQEVRP